MDSGVWHERDVTAAVAARCALTLAVTSPDSDGAFYASRGSGATVAPQLVVPIDAGTDGHEHGHADSDSHLHRR